MLTYFGSRDCWGTEHQCKWNLLLPACWISRISRQAHDAVGERKWLDVIYLLQFHGYSHLFMCYFEAYLDPSLFYIFCWLFSWKDYWIGGLTSVWILDSSPLGLPTKPYINLFSIANDSDHTVTWVRHSTCLTGSCQKYLSFCQLHSLATTIDSVFFTRHFGLAAKEDESSVSLKIMLFR